MEDGSVRIKSGPLTAAGAASAAGSHWSGSGAAAPGNEDSSEDDDPSEGELDRALTISSAAAPGWAKLRSEALRGGENASNALRVTGRYKSAARVRQRRGGDN